jgi:hypothetical protein
MVTEVLVKEGKSGAKSKSQLEANLGSLGQQTDQVFSGEHPKLSVCSYSSAEGTGFIKE